MMNEKYLYVIDNGEPTIYVLDTKDIIPINEVGVLLNELDHEITLLTKFILSKGYTLDDFNEWLVGELDIDG